MVHFTLHATILSVVVRRVIESVENKGRFNVFGRVYFSPNLPGSAEEDVEVTPDCFLGTVFRPKTFDSSGTPYPFPLFSPTLSVACMGKYWRDRVETLSLEAAKHLL